MASKSKLSVVIDIGTSKLVAIAGTKNEAGKFEISGVAKTPAKGIRRGVIFNIEEVAVSVRELLASLESKINERIEEVYNELLFFCRCFQQVFPLFHCQ